MNTNVITIGNIANIIAYGDHTNGCCKAVFAVEARLAFTSMTDAAEYFKVTLCAISHAVKTGGTIKGMHIVLLSDTNKAMEIIMTQAHREREAEERRLAKIEREKQKRNALIFRTKERIEKHEAKVAKEAEIIASLKEELAKLESEAK